MMWQQDDRWLLSICRSLILRARVSRLRGPADRSRGMSEAFAAIRHEAKKVPEVAVVQPGAHLAPLDRPATR